MIRMGGLRDPARVHRSRPAQAPTDPRLFDALHAFEGPDGPPYGGENHWQPAQNSSI